MCPRKNLIPSKQKDERKLECSQEPSLMMMEHSPLENLTQQITSSKLGLKSTITPTLREQVKRFLRERSEGYFIADLKDNEAQSKPGKLKASNFPASKIIIGYWKRESIYEGDLMAKCYFAKKKLVWEFLDGGLKSKMEIYWTQIISLRAQLPEGQPGVLEVELSMTPQFFREIDPQPKKHTQWKPSGDFTGGQAYINRRHCLVFPPEVLKKHYEHLLRSDPRLYQCSLNPFPSTPSPYLEPTFNTITNLPHSSGITNTSFQLQQIQISKSSYKVDISQQLALFPFLDDKELTLPISGGPCQESSMQFGYPNIQQGTKSHPPQGNPCDLNYVQNPFQQVNLYNTPQANCSSDIKVNMMEQSSSWMHCPQSQEGRSLGEQSNSMRPRQVNELMSSEAQGLHVSLVELELHSSKHNSKPIKVAQPNLHQSSSLPTKEENQVVGASTTLENHTKVTLPYQCGPPKKVDSFKELMGSRSLANSSLGEVFDFCMDDIFPLDEDHWYLDFYPSLLSTPETLMELQDCTNQFNLGNDNRF